MALPLKSWVNLGSIKLLSFNHFLGEIGIIIVPIMYGAMRIK